MSLKVFVGILVLLIAVCASAFATTHYVSHSGSNTFPYDTWQTAANTIGAANLATLAGDTMFIDTGSFQLTGPIYTQPHVTFSGRGMDSTLILGRDSGDFMFAPGDSTVFEHLHLDGRQYNNYPLGTSLGFFNKNGQTNLLCQDCKFSRFTYAVGFSYNYNSTLTILNCWFENWGSAAIDYTDRGNCVIENCTFYMPDHGHSICLFIGNTGSLEFRRNVVVGGGGYSISGASSYANWEFTNNLFFQNEYMSDAVWFPPGIMANNSFFMTSNDFGRPVDVVTLYGIGTRTTLIYNNIFAGYRPRFYINGPLDSTSRANIKVSYNCFSSLLPFTPDQHFYVWDYYHGRVDTASLDSVYANIYRDPMYLDPWNGDLRLQRGSPCIDAGAPWVLDIDGTRSDIGAFGGAGGGFYIYQDLPPKQPVDFTGTASRTTVTLTWGANTESDLYYYILYRSQSPGIPTDPAHALAYITPRDTTVMTYIDSTIIPQRTTYYALVAVDQSRLSSLSAPEISFTVTDVSDDIVIDLPTKFELEQNYPNPFNSTTAIVYNLPNVGAQPAPVRLTIYNLLGQVVQVIVDERQHPGKHVAYWDSVDNSGASVASGVYFYSLQVSGMDLVRNKKMVCLK